MDIVVALFSIEGATIANSQDKPGTQGPRNDHANCVKNVKISLMPSVDFQETEVCPDFKEEYKYVKRFSGSFSSIQDSTKNMDIPNHMKNLNPMKLFRRILDCTLRGNLELSPDAKGELYLHIVKNVDYLTEKSEEFPNQNMDMSHLLILYMETLNVANFSKGIKNPPWSQKIIPCTLSPKESDLPIVLSRQRRDFGITAAVVTAITLSAVAAGAAAASLTTSVPMAQALNNMSSHTARAFAIQAALNGQLHHGIMLVNQRVDLLQEQVDVLSQVITMACIVPMSGLCLTSVQYNNMTRSANLSKCISSMLTGVWTAEFDNITAQLRTEIVAINETCVRVVSAEEMLTWLRSSISFLKSGWD
ncbi:hypothetical protein STEG23_012555 [Scotinomys teguina]